MVCEQCGKENLDPDIATSIWIADESFQQERLGFFCGDMCLDNWWGPTE